MKRYLVTGGAGFIGSNIVEELVKRGEYVRVLDDLSTGKEENIAPFMDKIDFRRADIRDAGEVESALKDIDYVIHQAALRSVVRSIDRPMESSDVNINGTLNLLMSAKDAKVKRFTYASSSSIYGDCMCFPQKEDFLPKPISPYAVGKLAAEYYCRVFKHMYDIDTVSLRYFNVFGPRQDPESKYANVIPAFLKCLSENRPCTIDGDGMQSRDFTYISNVVNANLVACGTEGIGGMVINVACGKPHTVNEINDSLMRLMRKNIAPNYGPRRPGDVDKTFADISLLKEKLGLKELVGFDEGLKRTVKWFLEK